MKITNCLWTGGIWVNYNISLTWIKAIWGWFRLLTMIPVTSQWGRYNLPRGMMRYVAHFCWRRAATWLCPTDSAALFKPLAVARLAALKVLSAVEGPAWMLEERNDWEPGNQTNTKSATWNPVQRCITKPNTHKKYITIVTQTRVWFGDFAALTSSGGANDDSVKAALHAGRDGIGWHP